MYLPFFEKKFTRSEPFGTVRNKSIDLFLLMFFVFKKKITFHKRSKIIFKHNIAVDHTGTTNYICVPLWSSKTSRSCNLSIFIHSSFIWYTYRQYGIY